MGKPKEILITGLLSDIVNDIVKPKVDNQISISELTRRKRPGMIKFRKLMAEKNSSLHLMKLNDFAINLRDNETRYELSHFDKDIPSGVSAQLVYVHSKDEMKRRFDHYKSSFQSSLTFNEWLAKVYTTIRSDAAAEKTLAVLSDLGGIAVFGQLAYSKDGIKPANWKEVAKLLKFDEADNTATIPVESKYKYKGKNLTHGEVIAIMKNIATNADPTKFQFTPQMIHTLNGSTQKDSYEVLQSLEKLGLKTGLIKDILKKAEKQDKKSDNKDDATTTSDAGAEKSAETVKDVTQAILDAGIKNL